MTSGYYAGEYITADRYREEYPISANITNARRTRAGPCVKRVGSYVQTYNMIYCEIREKTLKKKQIQM